MKRFILLTILTLLNFHLAEAQTPWLHVSGNQIQDPAGNKVILRGVALQDITGQKADPTVGLNGLVNKLSDTTDAEAGVPGWYTKIVRFTVNPPVVDLAGYYTNTLKPAVDYAKSKGLYVIIDYHYIANVEANIESTNNFWTYMAPRFSTYSNVLFEIYNEPINSTMTWAQFKPFMQSWTNLIRNYAPYNLILIGNPRWDQAPGGAATNPVAGTNLVYVSHLYPGQFTSAGLKAEVQTAAAVVPVFLSEWGFSMSSTETLLQGTVTNYGDPIMTWAEGLGLHWTAWCADNDWMPAMFTSGWALKTGGNEMGQFVKQKLYDKRKLNQPSDIDCAVPFLGVDQTICSNIPITVASGLTAAGKTFTWYKDGAIIAGETGPSLGNISMKGKYKIKVDSGVCSMTDEINVVDTLFQVHLMSDAVLSDSIVLLAPDAANGYTYQWFHNGDSIHGAIFDSLKVFDTCNTKFSVNVSYTGCGTKSDDFNILCKWDYYLGHPIPVPGIVEAEYYNIGGLTDFSFHDSDPGNNGGKLRNDAVDIESCTDGVNQYNLGWTEAGEFVNYSINVTDPGTCGIILRIASGAATSGGSLIIKLNGVNRSGIVPIPLTGGWQAWQDLAINGIPFAATDTMLQVYIQAPGFNLNYMDIRMGVVAGINHKGKTASSLSIFPNPTNDVINFSNGLDKYDWKIYNTIGELVLSGSGEKADVSTIQRGTYVLIIEGEAFKILKW